MSIYVIYNACLQFGKGGADPQPVNAAATAAPAQTVQPAAVEKKQHTTCKLQVGEYLHWSGNTYGAYAGTTGPFIKIILEWSELYGQSSQLLNPILFIGENLYEN